MSCTSDDVTEFSKQPYVTGTIIIPLYRWGNWDDIPIFWDWKKSHMTLVFRDGQENSSHHKHMKKGNGALYYQWGEKLWRRCHWHGFQVSETMMITEFIMHPYLSAAPLMDGNYIYETWPQWQRARGIISTFTSSKGGTFSPFEAVKIEPWLTVGREDITLVVLCMNGWLWVQKTGDIYNLVYYSVLTLLYD